MIRTKTPKAMLLAYLCTTVYVYCNYDLTVVGPMLFAESIGGIAGGIIDSLKDDLRMNYIPTTPTINFDGMPESVKVIAQHLDKTPGKVILFTDLLWHTGHTPSNYVPSGGNSIKIAYPFIESTRIPSQWVNILNSKFDLTIVPDQFFVDALIKSGVTIPVFAQPCGILLEDFLSKPLKSKVNSPFVFGMSALGSFHKNFELLAEAFIKEFNNNPNVKLVLHCRTASNDYINQLRKKINAAKSNNVSVVHRRFKRADYVNFMASLDCYVLVSKGEGFSITPREALALGIPCILSDTTAHKTICATGLVRPVPALIEEPAYYGHLNGFCGHYYNCTLSDVRKALRDVYNNYEFYLKKAQQSREWVKQYTYSGTKIQFLNLVKPKKVELGDKNIISTSGIITNSTKLYQKYNTLLKNQ